MIRKLLIAALTLPIATACAAFQASATEITPQQTAALEATCTQVMRLRKGQSEFDGCVSSLSDALVGQIAYNRTVHAYQDCGHQGLVRDTPQYSRCVLEQEKAMSATIGAVPQLNAAYIKPADANPSDYFETSFGLRHQRKQYSCAQLGLEPDSEPFVTCVNNLDTNLFNIEHPPG